MSVRLDAVGDTLQRGANLPSLTAFTVCGWTRIVSNLGATTVQPIFWALDAGGTDGVLFEWNESVAGVMRIEVADGGAIAGGTDFGSRPAVGTDFFWYVKCSGTGANLIEAGWRAAGSTTFTTANTTLGGTINAPSAFYFGAILATYYADKRVWNVKCWDRALSAAEIEWESYYQRVVFPSSLNWHWWLRNANDTGDRGPNGRAATVGGSLGSEDEYGLWVPRALQSIARRAGVTTTRTLSESLTLTEQFLRYAFRPRLQDEVFSFSDASVSGARRGVVTTDNLRVVDDFYDWARRFRLGDEALALADGFVSWRRLARLSQDNLDLLDGSSKTVSGNGTVYARVLSETLALTDGFVSWRRLVRLLTENADLLDGFSKTLLGAGIVYARVLSDTTTLIDDAGQRWRLRNSRLTDAVGLSDNVIRALARIRIIGENIEFSDGAIRFLRAVRVPTDTIDLSDELIRAYFADQIFTVALVFGVTDPFRMSTYDPLKFSAGDPGLRFGGQ